MEAKVVTVFNAKGGVGKTTLVMQLAGALGRRHSKVLVIDMDSQASATQWAKQAADDQPFPANVIGSAVMDDKVHRVIQQHINDYDFIFVDCPPSKKSLIPSSALLASDLALIPVKPSPMDMWATQQAKELTEAAQERNPDLVVRVVPSMAMSTSNLARGTLELIKEDSEFRATRAQLGMRVAFQECQLLGGTVHALGSRDTKAVDEVESLADEVLSILRGTRVASRNPKGGKK